MHDKISLSVFFSVMLNIRSVTWKDGDDKSDNESPFMNANNNRKWLEVIRSEKKKYYN